MVCDEFEFQSLRGILFLKEKLRKRMFPRVAKRFLDSHLSYVFLTDVFFSRFELGFMMACVVLINLERLKEVFDLGI